MFVAEVFYLLVAFAFCEVFILTKCRDSGFLVLAGICCGSSILSFFLVSWWPLLVGGTLVVVGAFFGAGVLFGGRLS